MSPEGVEVCDELDNDCDGTVDEPDAADAASFYDDTDGDGYGDPDALSLACEAPSGAVADNTDCDDAVININPGAAEACDGLDNNCDGDIDDGVLGSGLACPASSCADILADQPGAPSGDWQPEQRRRGGASSSATWTRAVPSSSMKTLSPGPQAPGASPPPTVVARLHHLGAATASLPGHLLTATWDVSWLFPKYRGPWSSGVRHSSSDSWDGETGQLKRRRRRRGPFWSEALY
ncbi:MAG: putative metal-binding motif-containing protein [Deltaproteobacteria bacterium]|nr:putative metal-binding motif-containing protein [Deltaproteobacteria bacterium]